MRKGFRVEVAAKDVEKCSAIDFGEEGHGPDDFDCAVVFDGAAIIAIGFAGEDDAAKIKARSTQSGDGKQSVIDGAERSARNEKNRKRELAHEVGHELSAIDGDERATSAFNDETLVRGDFGELYFAELDADAGAFGSEVRRNGRREAIGFRQNAIARNARKADDGGAIGAFARARLNGLPVKRVERGAEKRGDSGFAYAGVCARDEKAARHARQLQTKRCAPRKRPQK